MRMRAWAIWAAVAGFSAGGACALGAEAPFGLGVVPAAAPAADELAGDAGAPSKWESANPPLWMAVVSEPQNVYPEIITPREPDANRGGVNFELDITWLNKYLFRGVNQTVSSSKPANALQFNTEAEFDLGKFPHPFIGLFVNVFNSDPTSRFEEVRPFFGLDWPLKPLTISAGYTSYIFPNRKNLDTEEVFLKIMLDDSRVFHMPTPLVSPYIFGAYDFSLYNGFYLETGLRHDFYFEDFGFTLSPIGRLAYVVNDGYFSLAPRGRDYGLQHYDAGMEGSVSINRVFNINHRYGEWSVNGYIFYTGRIDAQLRADTQVWGGVGLEFKY